MSEIFSIILPIAGVLLAAVVLVTADPKHSKWLTAVCGGLALVGGLAIYSYGYISTSGFYLQGILHAIFSVCRMFLGDADFGEFDDTGLFTGVWILTVNWLLHVLAVYATSSAAISIIGANALKKFRVRFAKKKNLNIIFGVNDASVDFGQALTEQAGSDLVIYVSDDAQAQLTDAILESDAILCTDSKALSGSEAFLRSIGMGKGQRELTLYALHPDYNKNFDYAKALLNALEARGVNADRISLVIHGKEEECVKHLQIQKEQYGYGFVTVFRENDMAVRLLMREYPPCSVVDFNADCTAKENFEAMVIGFGQLGQLVLRNLIMNGQFIGSNFRADVFESNITERSGHFINCFPAIMSHYRVNFHPHDGRSEYLYAHLTERLDQVKYIAVCTGCPTADEEIAEQLQEFISRKGKNIPVLRCSTLGVQVIDPNTARTTTHALYHPDVLATRTLDVMAMAVNQSYNGTRSKGAVKDWMVCDYFSRQSNRAVADFIPAVLKAANKTEEDAQSGTNWTFTNDQMTVLGQMEHARWNAFHFCNGYTTMSDSEFESRKAMYIAERETLAKAFDEKFKAMSEEERKKITEEKRKKMLTPSIRIGKNTVARTHACLISWEALNDLDIKEKAVTGKDPTYQAKDINNINQLPTMLKLKEDAETEKKQK